MRLLALALLVVHACGHFTSKPSSANCTELWYDQTLDHFNWGPPNGQATYRQRYFTYDKYWRRGGNGQPPGPIFFYFGNEDDVTLYVNNTGLMWENAETFQALLVFAEHRYYGLSRPYPDGTPNCMGWLTTEQALADFAELIDHLRQTLPAADQAPVIGFGGSYGGMMAAWFRMKYPNSVDGCIAASAPIWSFLGQPQPWEYDPAAFFEVVTADASSEGGATDYCKANVKLALPRIAQLGQTADGLALLSRAFNTCQPLRSSSDAMDLVFWVTDPWASLAMGDFPYPSGYLLHGHGLLPAWPVRKTCEPLDRPLQSDELLMAALRDAMGVWYNHTGDVRCYFNGDSNEYREPRRTMRSGPGPFRRGGTKRDRAGEGPNPNPCGGDWDYQWCTEMVQPFTSGTGRDMFYPPSPFSMNDSVAHCRDTWGVTPRPYWSRIGLDGTRIQSATNILFSNGKYDPWHTGGVLKAQGSTLPVVWIPSGAHHIDLMFSDPADPPDVLDARNTELGYIRTWLAEAYAKRAQQQQQ